MLQVENLCKSFGGIQSVKSVNFELGENEIVGLLGENGAGKSTTMNMLTGCLPQTSGRILFHGEDTTEVAEMYKSRLGYLPEIPPLYLDMTVYEQLYFVCGVKSIAKAERNAEIERVCDLTNIAHMRNRLTRNLSKGYKQRVGLAQALIADPCILVLDEPMAGLDPRQITEMRELITSLEMTVIISSHILSEISAMCSRLIVLKQGSLITDSPTSEFLGLATGEGVIHLRIKGNRTVAENILSTISGVTKWQEVVSTEEGCYEYSVIPEQGVDIRENVFFSFAKESIPIIYFELKKPTLEDIFIDITS